MEREFIQAIQGSLSDFRFQHVLTSDAIYKTMLRRDRELLHGQVAQTIEELYADRLDSQVELLAEHFLKSHSQHRALHYLILAGQKAARDFANEQARQHFELALGLLSKVHYEPLQLLQIQLGLGGILALVGEYQAARAHFSAALEAVIAQHPERFMRERSDLQRMMDMTFERREITTKP